jgi:type III pantothenate kinase
MLLAVDIGNSNVVLGLLEGERVVRSARIETLRQEDAARAEARLAGALTEDERGALTGAIVASVIPPLAPVFAAAAGALARAEAVVVDHTTSTGVLLDVDAPAEVGADRYVNLAALVGRGGEGAIVVDCGTATTFDVLSPDGRFVGGAIAPGLGITADALRTRAPRLPPTPLTPPPSAIGRCTLDALRSGVVLGYAAMVEGLLSRMRSELPYPVRVYATGGLAPLLSPCCPSIDVLDTDLTLRGLARIHARHAARHPSHEGPM